MTNLQQGYTTGSCVAAAVKAAALLLCQETWCSLVDIPLPDGTRFSVPVLSVERTQDGATAAIRKDAGDDPDITQGVVVLAALRLTDGDEVTFEAGEGVGIVTRPGLSVPPGEPAINPGPRRMICAALREVTDRGAHVIASIPGGRELAAKTFNPRLGVIGGLSILGTTGRVRAFSHEAIVVSLKCGLDVAVASGIRAPVFVPGNIGEKAARRFLRVTDVQVVNVGNEWGKLVDHARQHGLHRILALGHPGKLAKLCVGDWDTHSSRSQSATGPVTEIARGLLSHTAPESLTVEGIFTGLSVKERELLAKELCRRIRMAIAQRLGNGSVAAAALVNMAGEWLGEDGDLSPWR